MLIKKFKSEESFQIARLHINSISTGFISSLGERFVTVLYQAIADSPYGFGFIAEENGSVLGFVTFAMDINQLYKSIIFKKGIKFAVLLAGKMFSISRIKRVLQTLFYPSRVKSSALPSAELLSIAVAPEGRGKGIGKELVAESFKECRKRGLDKVKVLVAAENEAANKLYQKCGFGQVTQIDSHGVLSNIYIKEL